MQNKSTRRTGSLSRPDAAEPGIYTRGKGRQLLISTGRDLSEDHDPSVDKEGDQEDQDAGEEDEDDVVRRGRANGFGEGPRRRLRERVHAIDRDAEGLFITLTYHETEPTTERVKKDFDALWAWLEREYNGSSLRPISCVWKLEPQERGVPHIHLILYGLPFIPAQKLSRRWHEITAETSEKHRKAGVDIETAVNQDGKLQGYLAEYMEKTYDHWPGAEPGDDWWHPGRWWGFRGRDYLPIGEWEDTVVRIHQREAEALIDELLNEWGVELPDHVTPPTLIINTRGSPGERLLDLIDRI